MKVKNKIMHPTAQLLLDTIEKALPLLRQISGTEASAKTHPDQWSNQEILGHLIDSASNNQHKFVRTMQVDRHLDFAGYAQNFWVEAQRYNQASWPNLLALWESYNRHLAHIIQHTPPEKLENTISINGSQPFALHFIMADYVEHLKHHLRKILPDAGFDSSFENLY